MTIKARPYWTRSPFYSPVKLGCTCPLVVSGVGLGWVAAAAQNREALMGTVTGLGATCPAGNGVTETLSRGFPEMRFEEGPVSVSDWIPLE